VSCYDRPLKKGENNMADLSKIKLPSGSEYNFKDAYARE